MNRKIFSQLYHHTDFIQLYYKTFDRFYKMINMKGGGYNIDYHDINIKFNKMIEDERISLYLSTLDQKDSCIFIIIDKQEDFAYIQGLSNNKYTTCFSKPELNNGRTIMEITIKMLKKYKDKLKIKAIELTDNSYFQCSDKVKIWLADLSFLQYSDTWYGRFGFRVKDDKKINIIEIK